MEVKTSSGTFTIPPNSTKAITLSGDNTVVLVAGNQSKTYSVKENQKPKLSLQVLVPQSGDEISLRQIQSTIGYRITITDDYSNQLDYKITGPVTFKEVQRNENQIVIDVRLNYLGSKAAFDQYVDNHPGQNVYTATFSVNVKDKIAPHTVSQIGIFRFTDW
jgi:competence protein ComGC